MENKQRAIDAIKKHNIKDKARSITTYDFSTLSANITLSKLKNMIRELTVSVLKVIYNSLLRKRFDTTWIDDKSKFKITFDKAFQRLTIIFFIIITFLILLICHVDKSLGSLWVLTQHLLWEIQFYFTIRINSHYSIKRDLHKTRLFDNLVRFLSDLCDIDNRIKFNKNYKDIYPSVFEI